MIRAFFQYQKKEFKFYLSTYLRRNIVKKVTSISFLSEAEADFTSSSSFYEALKIVKKVDATSS